MRKYLFLIVRVLFAAAGIAYIVYSVTWTDQADQPGVLTMLGKARWSLLGLGMVLIGTVYALQAFRWWLLMRCRDIQVTLGRAMKLFMVGVFFNVCMPGTTGGDVVKAFYAVQRTTRRADAVMSIIFDRITGLLALVMLAAVASLFVLHEPVGPKLAMGVCSVAAVMLLGFAIYMSGRLQRMLGVHVLRAKLRPGGLVHRVTDAAAAYRHHPTAVAAAIGISLVVHVLVAIAAAVAGYAMGMTTSFGLILAVWPIITMAGAIPVAPLGLGVMEATARTLLEDPVAASANQLLAMVMLVRLYQVVYGLLSATLLIRGDIHMHPPPEPSTQQP